MDVTSLKNIRGCNICCGSTDHTDWRALLLRPPPGLCKWSNHIQYESRDPEHLCGPQVHSRAALTQSEHSSIPGAVHSSPPSISRDALQQVKAQGNPARGVRAG